jgi:23S rRNA (adenine2503-C2)-methyltransferase
MAATQRNPVRAPRNGIRTDFHPMPSLHDLPFPRLEAMMAVDGLRNVHARALWRTLYHDLDPHPAASESLLPPIRRWLAAHSDSLTTDQPSVASQIDSADGLTHKFLLRLDDGQEIETVIMGYQGRSTVCLSTQAGCAMGCVFCATGQMGFVRHLRPGEIVAQVLHAKRFLRSLGQSGPRNVVLMGMGEPLHNIDSVLTALSIISDNRTSHIAPSRISVSTVGVVPGILRFADENIPYHLAVSLHAATDEERSALIPVNRRWPLPAILDACRYYGGKTKRRIFFGWTLIAGKNDTPEHARQVAGLLHGIDAHVNLIPLNLTEGYDGRTSAHQASVAFQKILRQANIPSTVRQRRGIDVAAGCGQLRARKSQETEK